ncbi:hypothetical protein Trydic_g10752 [Trypoxylus dichotomus]
MPSVKINEDLRKEREKCSFDPIELTYLIDGGKEKTAERKEREKFFLDDPQLKQTVPLDYLSHKEKYEEALKRACIVFRKVQQLQGQGKVGMQNFREILGGQLGSAILRDGNPLGLHYVMFIPTIMGQGTIDQQAEWISKAWNLDIVGTYAQTELGHGTFIRGLETTATYDPKREEFVLNSPTLTSYKWWPGGLGHTANYAVVVAQLYSQGTCHGFDNVRIPRNYMLMKNGKILKDGSYVKSPSSKLTYGTMIFVRVVIVQDAANYLRKAATIAVRYSAVRHQSHIKENAPEPQILDFVTQQYKLFPQISTYFALHHSGLWLWDMYNNVTSELESGQLDRLPELHALACCLKAVSAADAAEGVEICRLACGGHGYMSCSSLPVTYGLVTAMITYEGENTVLFLQTARFLMKAWQSCLDGQPLTPSVQYLNNVKQSFAGVYQKSVPWIINAMQRIAAGKIEVAHRHMNDRIRRGLDSEYAWNETSIELVAASVAHCRAFIVETYYNSVLHIVPNVSKQLGKVLTDLCELYSVYTLLKCTGDLLRFNSVTARDLEDLQRWLEDVLAAIRPNAIGIVDGFDINDAILASPLGAYDGNVYERLFEEAARSPLNAEPVNQSFHKYLKPLLKSKM